MPIERVNIARVRVARRGPKAPAAAPAVFVLVRFKAGGESWYAVSDLTWVLEPYEIIGYARRV